MMQPYPDATNTPRYHSKPSQLSNENSGHFVPPGTGHRSAVFPPGPAGLYCGAGSTQLPRKQAPLGQTWQCAPAETGFFPSYLVLASHQMCQIGCRLARPKVVTGTPCLPASITVHHQPSGLCKDPKRSSMATILCSHYV